jgi:serine/threonine protein kinase
VPLFLIGAGKGPQALINPTLNDFDVKHLLGKGAYGEVYLAQHKLSKKWMALKQMDKMLISMQGKVKRVDCSQLTL